MFDIDFLSERSLVKNTVEAFGGAWEEFETLWTQIDAAVRGGNPAKNTEEIKNAIIQRLNSAGRDELPKGDITDLMKQGKPWANIKKYGSAAIPSGDAQRYFSEFRSKLESRGIYIIHVGQMENFCTEIGGHGPKYVTELLSTVPLGDARLRSLREFVSHVHEKD
ncbi:hypothetical protein ACFSSA_11215 [Luteolibacter algae]|uniref:Uncharacterized protein n=1 Tax=Luteolibacter algae TaxID=454151 RepID=A0ABW5DCW9_9BACT